MSNLRINWVFFWVFHFQVTTDWKPSITLNRHRWENFTWRRCFEVCS